jgi:long-subunit fatty acid transport protein
MRFLTGFMLLSSAPAWAGSISAPGVIGGPESGAATPNVASIHYNPAALGALPGTHVLFDTQLSQIHVEATATRNEGIDPNTGEAYAVATADAMVPVFVLGATTSLLDDRLTFGIAASDAFVGGGDYSGGETNPPPYTGHQRYAGVTTKIITLAVTPAMGFTVTDGIHVGAGASWVYDSISAFQASDALGNEGLGFGEDAAYGNDSYLEIDASGSHWGWNAGIFVDRFELAQVGLSYSAPSQFSTAGTGTVYAAEFVGGVDVPAKTTVEIPLPGVIRGGVASQVNEKLRVEVGFEYQLWAACCGGQDGDIVIGLTNEDGNPIGADDGVTLSLSDTQYSPRRLWNAMNLLAVVGYEASDKLWLGGRASYNQNAVPDFAVSATNLDFESVGGGIAARWQVAGPVSLGLGFMKFFPFERVIKNAAWDVRDQDDAAYRDERFSPVNPYKASANGTYTATNNTLGIRLQVDL